MLEAIDRDRYEVIPIGITRDGAFVLERDDPDAFRLDPDALPEVRDDGSSIDWPERAGSRRLTITAADGATRTVELDVVFPILHGLWGEDGTIQGMLELTGVPYVGSGVLGSALGMDKHFTKSVLRAAGIPVADWVTLTRADWESDPAAATARVAALGVPAFVKPARAGSSVGVTRIDDVDALPAALATAFREDGKAIVESAVNGRELEIGVLASGRRPRASVAGEIVVTGRGFYDFDAKYLDAPGVELICPAELDAARLAELQELAVRAFTAIDADGLARVDVFLTADGFVVNEVNTMPGFTPISMFPRCWAASGLAYSDLICELISSASEKATARR